MRSHHARRGASLIEVLVVLVILLIGVFSVIRVFPLGFRGLRQAENRTLATQLANQLVEQMKAQDANAPQGVLFQAYDTATNPPTPFLELSTDPDDLGQYALATKPNDSYYKDNPYFADVNKFRTIVGEPAKVPLPTATVFGAGSLYTVKFGPIYMDPSAAGAANTAPPNTGQYLHVYGAPLRGVYFQADPSNPQIGAGFLRGQTSYLIDYDYPAGALILFAPRAPAGRSNAFRDFRVSFSYFDQTLQRPVSVPAFTIRVPDSNAPAWQPIQDAATNKTYNNIFEGSESVSREFTRIPANQAQWDPLDPYQYKLLSPNVNKTYANIGLMAFNPAGANYAERTPFGEQAFTAYVDYSVLDWHILREDREVPSVLLGDNQSIPVKLTLPFLKRIGDTESGNRIYSGLYGTAGSPDIQVFNLQGNTSGNNIGAPLKAGDYDNPLDTDDYWINFDERAGTYRTGTIYVNPKRVPPGSQLRILYKAEGDWAVALQKAYSNYTVAATNALVPLPRPTAYNNFGQDGTRLYFSRSDLNKSVVATVEYTLPTGEVKRLQPTQFTIDQVEPTAGPQGERYAFVDVAAQLPTWAPLGGDSIQREFIKAAQAGRPWRVVGAASGSSVKARVIWHDNASETNTWRIQDIDSYITPVAGS